MAEENGEERTEEHILSGEDEGNAIESDAEAESDWRVSLGKVMEIMEASLETAHAVLTRFADGAGLRSASMDATVRLADSIFSATVTTEHGRRQLEIMRLQQSGQQITIPGVEIAGQARSRLQVQIPRPGGKRG